MDLFQSGGDSQGRSPDNQIPNTWIHSWDSQLLRVDDAEKPKALIASLLGYTVVLFLDKLEDLCKDLMNPLFAYLHHLAFTEPSTLLGCSALPEMCCDATPRGSVPLRLRFGFSGLSRFGSLGRSFK